MITSQRMAARVARTLVQTVWSGKKVSDLDQEWARRLAEAEQKARASGRGDVAAYLALRASNDMARAIGVEWLLETFTALAGEANRTGASINLTQQDAHRFHVGTSTMVGSKLTLRAGVRALIVEAGWPRTPHDGIVRGGGLASAKISHFGNRAAGEDLLLIHGAEGVPQWVVLENSGARSLLSEDHMRHHIAKLLTGN